MFFGSTIQGQSTVEYLLRAMPQLILEGGKAEVKVHIFEFNLLLRFIYCGNLNLAFMHAHDKGAMIHNNL